MQKFTDAVQCWIRRASRFGSSLSCSFRGTHRSFAATRPGRPADGTLPPRAGADSDSDHAPGGAPSFSAGRSRRPIRFAALGPGDSEIRRPAVRRLGAHRWTAGPGRPRPFHFPQERGGGARRETPPQSEALLHCGGGLVLGEGGRGAGLVLPVVPGPASPRADTRARGDAGEAGRVRGCGGWSAGRRGRRKDTAAAQRGDAAGGQPRRGGRRRRRRGSGWRGRRRSVEVRKRGRRLTPRRRR